MEANEMISLAQAYNGFDSNEKKVFPFQLN